MTYITHSIAQDIQQLKNSSPSLNSIRTDRLKHIFHLTMIYWVGMLSYFLINTGLSQALGLYTFIHGTSPRSYVLINLCGANVKIGGSHHRGATAGLSILKPNFTETHKYRFNSINYFHMFSEPQINIENNYRRSLQKYLDDILTIYLSTKRFSVLSGIGDFHRLINGRFGKFFKIPYCCIGTILGLATPRIRFQFTGHEIKELIRNEKFVPNDPDYKDPDIGVFKSRIDIPSSRIGITGALFYGINRYTWKRITNNPARSLTGVFLFFSGLALGIADYAHYRNSKVTKDIVVPHESPLQKLN